MVMNDDRSWRKLSYTHQDELKRNLSSRQDFLNLPEPGLVAIDKGSPAPSEVEKQYVISKVGDKDMDNDLGEKELLTYEVKNNLFNQSLQVSATEHTPSIMEVAKEDYAIWLYNSEPFVVPKEGSRSIISGFPSLSQEEIESELTDTVLNLAHTLDESYYPEIARDYSLHDSKRPRKGTS